MKLSVLMITYNHEKFIAQALESVLMQDGDFEYEIVVGEDCSTDSTKDILIGYQKNHPEKFRLLFHDKNVGAISNFVETFKNCSGDYIAILEGDDYWTDSSKLRKQIQFLDSHPGYSACFHNVMIYHEDNPEKDGLFHENKLKQTFTLEDILLESFIPTCSVMFRNRLFANFPQWIFSMPMGDWPLHVLNAEHGDYGYLDEVLGCYRVHDNGIWSMKKFEDVMQETITSGEVINKYLDFKFNRKMHTKFAKSHFEISRISFTQGNWKKGFKHLYKCFRALILGDFISSAKLPFILLWRILNKSYCF